MTQHSCACRPSAEMSSPRLSVSRFTCLVENSAVSSQSKKSYTRQKSNDWSQKISTKLDQNTFKTAFGVLASAVLAGIMQVLLRTTTEARSLCIQMNPFSSAGFIDWMFVLDACYEFSSMPSVVLDGEIIQAMTNEDDEPEQRPMFSEDGFVSLLPETRNSARNTKQLQL